MEEGPPKEEGREGLQCAENGRRGRSDVLNGSRGAEEGDGGGEERQRHEVEPMVPMFRCPDRCAEVEPEEEKHCAKQQDVEGELQRGQLLEERTIDPDDVDRIRKGRAEGQQ